MCVLATATKAPGLRSRVVRGCVHRERGQAMIGLVLVLLFAGLLIVAIGTIASAMAHRAHARNAADAVALAAAVDPYAADQLAGWYRQHGAQIITTPGHAQAHSGPSHAAAWADTTVGDRQPAPVLVAIIARAEQLLEIDIVPLNWETSRVTLLPADASALVAIAAELALCPAPTGATYVGAQAFELC